MNFDENLEDFGCGLEEESSMSRNAAAFLKAFARSSTVCNLISEEKSEEKKESIVKDYVEFCYELEDGKIKRGRNAISISFNGSGFESISGETLPNLVAESLSTVYLVEFFTHCCINCIHSIEDVREVHDEIEKEFVAPVRKSTNGFKGMKVLSVHSPKFPREKDLTSIKAFCKRMKMDHSKVINDPECILWNEFGVSCWPTLLILGPNPDGQGHNLLFNFMGEDHKSELLITIKTAMNYFLDKLYIDSPTNSSVSDDKVTSDIPDFGITTSKFIRFPGKVAVYGEQMVISDSGNNRLISLDRTGNVLVRSNFTETAIVGRPQKGNRDGSFEEAQFYNPQGIAFETSSIFYVADTGNHAVRKVDLISKQVTSLVKAGSTVEMNGELVILKSPWDLCFYDSNSLIVAAAGNHRLFGYFFEDTILFGAEHKKDTFAVIAGSGREENRNNSYIMKASFSQPSGIITDVGPTDEKVIYIADSESSSIRSISMKGQVMGVVGGSRDPTDLFAFGDVDGKATNAKLQHPMGVCGGINPSEIFIADTYNHKIKKINVTSKESQTFVSSEMNEPSGICLDSVNELLYVADTNNHSIKIIDIKTASIRELEIITPTVLLEKHRFQGKSGKDDKCFHITRNINDNSIKVNIILSPLPESFEGGQWKLLSDEKGKFFEQRGNVGEIKNENQGCFSFTVEDATNDEVVELRIIVDIFFCVPNSCLKRTRKIIITCCKSKGNECTNTEHTLEWKNLVWEV